MTNRAELRRRFLAAFWRELGIIWPILSGLMGVQLLLGLLAGYFQQWSAGEAAYFTFITGLTIGYGDLAPSRPSTRIIAVAIGFIGILITGLIAAVGVRALQLAADSKIPGEQS
jgi:hypothetical protein